MARLSRLLLVPAFVVALGLLSTGLLPGAVSAQGSPATDYRATVEHWEAGRYHEALPRLIGIMKSPAAATYLERIALLTGEWYPSVEIAKDGRLPKLSPDGQWVTYETGPATAPVTRILRATANAAVTAELQGGGAVAGPVS